MKKQNRKISGSVRATEAPIVSHENTPVNLAEAYDKIRKDVEHLQSVLAKGFESRIPVNCKASGSVILAKKTWVVGEPVVFQYMPGGITTLYPTLGREGSEIPIELSVNVTAKSAQNIQNAFERICASSPRRLPFLCIEHKAEERAGQPLRFDWNDVPEGGIYCTAEPSELGARNVNGKMHTSFSPTFDTDADYAKLQCSDCTKGTETCACSDGRYFRFPVGARGSKNNPAEITAPDCRSAGSLTNWPAFRDILPIAAKEHVNAAGNSEGAKKGWEARHHVGNQANHAGHYADGMTGDNNDPDRNTGGFNWADGAREHQHAAGLHDKAAMMHKEAGDSEASKEHMEKALHHKQLAHKYSRGTINSKETNLAQTSAGQATPQPATSNAENTKGLRMKVFIKARDGSNAWAAQELDGEALTKAFGEGARTEQVHAEIQARESEVSAERAKREAIEKAKRDEDKSKIIAACERGVARGSIFAKGDAVNARDTVQAKYVGRFERSECAADICVEQIDAMPVVQTQEHTRHTTSSGTGQTMNVSGGEVSGNELVKKAIEACEPFTSTLRSGGIVRAARNPTQLMDAIEKSREKNILMAKLNREIQGGFVIRAATYNYVDPAANNPLGLLNTELMVLNNLGHLENQLAPLRDITTNIAGMPVAFNQQVRTRYFAIPKVQLKTDATAWSGGTGSNTDVNVKLDTYAGVEIAVGNTLLASTPRNIFAEQYDPQLYGLGEYIVYKLVRAICDGTSRIDNTDDATANAQITNTFNITDPTLATFVSSLPAKMNLLKIPGGDEQAGASQLARFAWVHTSAYASATTDTNFLIAQSIQSVRAGNSTNGNIIETGNFDRLGNLKFRQSQLMTDTVTATGSGADGTTNGIVVSTGDYTTANTLGVAGTKSAVLFVSRIPEDYTTAIPGIPNTAAVEVVTSPGLGISFLVVKYLDHAYEIAKLRVQIMFGFGIGDERQAVLLQKNANP